MKNCEACGKPATLTTIRRAVDINLCETCRTRLLRVECNLGLSARELMTAGKKTITLYATDSWWYGK